MRPTRLVFCNKTSNKFWEGNVEGKHLVVRFGKIGSDGQTKKKALASPAAAKAELAKVINDKRSKGYVDHAATRATKAATKPATKPAPARRPKGARPENIASRWAALEQFVATTPQKLYLRPPAKESAIRAAERTMKLTFPDGFRESLLAHDGQEPGDGDDSDTFSWLPGHPRLASLDRIVDAWKDHVQSFEKFHPGEPPAEIDGGRMVHYIWHPKRIPIAGNPWWDQDNTYLDFIPGSRGVAGQLVCFGKGYVDGLWCAADFSAAFALYVDAVVSKRWLWDRGCFARDVKKPPKQRTRWNAYASKQLAV